MACFRQSSLCEKIPTMFDFSGYRPNKLKSHGAFILVVTLLFSFSTAGASPDKEKHSDLREKVEPSE